MRRGLGLLLVLVIAFALLQAPPGAVAPPGLLGGSTTAPQQESRSADGLGPAGNTSTSLAGPNPVAARPPGAVPDKPDIPAAAHPQPQSSRLTDVPVRQEGAAKSGFDAKASVADPAQRTANSTVFRNPDGSTTRRLYSEPTNVQRPDGSWAPTDLTLTPGADGRLTPKLAPVKVSLGRQAGSDLGRVELDADHTVSFGIRGTAQAEGRLDGARVVYPKVLRDTDLTLTATKTGIKEDIVLHTADAPASYEFDLALRGLAPVRDKATGDIRLMAGNDVRAVIPAGWMRDAQGGEPRAVHYELSEVDKAWRLRVSVDQAWLREPGRAFPVTIDPPTQINTDADDTYVTSGSAANRSGEIQLKVGKEGSGGISAAYLHFSGLQNGLRNQYINGASLVLHNAGSASCTPKPVDVFAVGAPWSGATLTTWPGAPLGQFLAQRSFAHGAAGCPAGVYEPFALPADLVTDWTHGSPFYGFSVRSSVEGDSGAFKRFSSGNATGVPYLDIQYAPQGAAYRVDEVTLPTANQNGRIKATVTNRGSATWRPGGPHRFGFIVKQNGVVVQTSPKFDVPGDVGPTGSTRLDVPMGPLTPGDYQVFLTMYDGEADYNSAYGVPYGVFDMKVVNVPPSVNHEQPGNGAAVDSLTPTLYAEGVDTDNWPNKGLRFNFKICDGTAQAPVNCTESGWTSAGWSVPANRLRWSTTYHWWVQAHDTINAGPFAGPLALTTRVPQPEITAHLGGTPQGAPAPGIDPQVGNFGTATKDADIATVGPDLTVTRTYNSLDPRTDTAFGQGWASRLDTQLRHDEDGSGNEVVTLPSGRQVRFGRNADGSYAPPQGQNLTLVLNTSTGYYQLRDSSGGSWEFNPWGHLRTITDPSGLTEELEYDPAGPPVKPLSVVNRSSGRRLYLTWVNGHVTNVRTDPPATGTPALQWNYTYTGHQLTSACDPGPAPNCTRYAYQPGSHYRSVVLDDAPRAYYRFGESNGLGGAASATARTPNADKGTYNGVALGAAGPLAGTADTGGAFDGASSRVDLPPKLISPSMSIAAELWFRTTTGGVLLSYADKPFGTTSNLWTPVLYVGQDGHLRGGFWVPKPDGARQISSQNPVNDGQWHHAVLSGAINNQTLYVDGVAQPGTITGFIDHDEMPNLTVGTGKTAGWASGNNGDYFFTGNIDEVSLYSHPLGATAVATHFAAKQSVVELTRITLPQDDRIAASLTYDDINDRVATYTDHDGRAWRLDNPARNEAVRTVTLHGPYPDWTYTYDADNGGRLTAQTHDGKARRTSYNAMGFVAEEFDENNHKATFTTDQRGNVLSRTTCRAANSCQTGYSTYFLNAAAPLDPRNDRKLSDSDPRSANADDVTYRTTYAYDTVGRLITTTYPKPNGVANNPTEAWRYSTGTEAADGGGNVPAGLLIEHTGKRAGQTTRYTYRANGDLAETITPTGLRTRCEYDGIGRKTSDTTMSAAGAVFGRTDFTYTARSQVDTVSGPIVRNTITATDHRQVTRFNYDANGNKTQITMSDTAGADPPRTTTYGYNEHDHLISTTLPDQARTTREYRNAGMEVRTTDPRGTTWIDYSDSQGRLLRRVANGPGVDPEDSSSTVLTLETRSYDAAGRLAASRDAMGRETQYTYYDDDLPATTTLSGVLVDQREYDPAGHVTKLTASGGRVTTSTFDPAGYPVTTALDPTGLNRVTSYLRDPDGLVRTESHTGAADPSRTESVNFGYNADGQLLREDVQPTPGDTLSVTYIRDERGLVTQQADRRRLATDFTYDAYGRMVTTTAPEVEIWVAGQRRTGVRPQNTVGYNTFGDPTHQRDANGAITVLGYDAASRVTSTQLPDYTPPGGQVIRALGRIEYDPAGNPTKTIDALGRVTERTYDPHNRMVTETLPKVGDQPSTTTIGFDRNGERVSVTNPAGIAQLSTYDNRGRKITDTAVERLPQTTYFTTTYGFDDADNQTSVTTPGGSVSRATYNAAGEQLTTTDATTKVTSYAYDIVGRLASTTDPAGMVTRTSYDLLGRATTIAQLAGNPLVEQRRWQQSFDPNDNLLSVTTPEGRLRSVGYDAVNRIVRQDEKVNASKTIRTTFGYDATGNRTRFVDGNSRATDYTHTPWGLPESLVEAGATWTTSYDAAGQQVRLAAPGGVTVDSTFDAQGRLAVERGAGAEAPTADKTFGYDSAGRMTSFGTTTLSYDDRGNLLTTRGSSGDATFTYDADSRVATRADASGNASYSYDAVGRTASIVDSLSGRTIDHVYDNAGRFAYTTERGMAQYVKRVSTYDPLGRLTSDKDTEFDPSGGASRVILGTEYGYDRDDNITAKTTISNDQRTANSYGYDGANRLTTANTTTYDWDDAGNRTRAGTTTYTYNDRNQLISDGTTQYTYTPRGTQATAGSRASKFDAFDQLAQDGSVSYSYDSLGRIAKRGTTTFAYGSLENDVVSDGTRLISRDFDGQPLSDNPIGSTLPGKLLYADQHGDVVGRYRGLSNFGQRSFDPFGNVTSSSGEQPSLGYQGEWTEPTTGAVNMHSRWFAPATGTFASRDTWTVPATSSVAANRYAYADANPTGNTDPTGHLECDVKPVSLAQVLSCVSRSKVAKPVLRRSPVGSIFSFLDGEDTIRGGCADLMYQPDGTPCPQWAEALERNRQAVRLAKLGGPSVDAELLRLEHESKRGYGRGSSTPGGGGGGCRVVCRVVPPPPPPPLWLVNIWHPVARAVAGSTVVPRPDTVQASTQNTTVIDNSAKYAEEANEVTDQLVAQGLSQFEIQRVSRELANRTKDEESCLTGSGPSAQPPNYWGLVDNRATGADVCLNYANQFKGSRASKDPDGYLSGMGMNRGHLIARRFGGSGSKLENLVPITRSANNEGMKSDFESCVADRMDVAREERIFYISVPVYNSDRTVNGVAMVAIGNQGYGRGKYIPNVPKYTPGSMGYCK